MHTPVEYHYQLILTSLILELTGLSINEYIVEILCLKASLRLACNVMYAYVQLIYLFSSVELLNDILVWFYLSIISTEN